jgi:type IV pilus assembly protein PilC
MPRYSYEGTHLNGDRAAGIVRAADTEALRLHLFGQGIIASQIVETLHPVEQEFLAFYKGNELTRMTRQLSLLLKSKIPALEAFSLVIDQAGDQRLRRVFAEIYRQLESGKSVADSLAIFRGIFTDVYRSMVYAGEVSGQLDTAFERIADYRERSEALTRKVRAALTYPVMVLFVAALVISVLFLYVIPIFVSMYENFGVTIPSLTQTIIDISAFFQNQIMLIIGLLVIILLISVVTMRTQRFQYEWDKLMYRIPFLSAIVVKTVTARFSRSMGELLLAGVDIVHATEIAAQSTGNRYVIERLEAVKSDLIIGQSLTIACEKLQLFSKPLLRLIASGEKTGQLGEMLVRSAEYYEAELSIQLQTLTTLLEPIVIVVLGLIISVILIAMYLPLFGLVDAI